jgi:outer membrane protein, heavy metal efflux system
VKKYYPALPPLGPEATPAPGPDGKPLTLADLQRLARANSPLLRQAAADIKAAKGAAVQAGLYPNPVMGPAINGTGPGGGPYFGFVAAQTVKTMGKLGLAKAAAEMDVKNAELAYRKAETELMTQVRTGYFAVLVAQESVRAQRALVQLTDELFRVMIAQAKGGERALYEPMQVGVLAGQARANLLMARNDYQLAWRTLAAALGLPALPLTALSGHADMPVPRYDYQESLARVLALHTDMTTTANGMQKARYNLRLAEVAPIPDVNVSATVQHDSTLLASIASGPNRIVLNGLQTSIVLPIFDRNQGGIRQAQGSLLRAVEEPHRVRAELTARFAEAFRRYDESRAILHLYRTSILPKQVQAFRSAVKRHNQAGPEEGVAYTDLIQAEQNLVAAVSTYLTTLGTQWQAVADVAGFLQTDDLFQLAQGAHPTAGPDLTQLLALPCCHVGAPAASLGFSPENVNWTPSAVTLGQSESPAPR